MRSSPVSIYIAGDGGGGSGGGGGGGGAGWLVAVPVVRGLLWSALTSASAAL